MLRVNVNFLKTLEKIDFKNLIILQYHLERAETFLLLKPKYLSTKNDILFLQRVIKCFKKNLSFSHKNDKPEIVNNDVHFGINFHTSILEFYNGTLTTTPSLNVVCLIEQITKKVKYANTH